MYNYEDKLKKYHTINKKNKTLPEGSKIKKNAFSSPSQMNELCDYINRWEKKKILWNNNYEHTEVLLVDHDIQSDNIYILKQMKRLNRDFNIEWNKMLKEKNENPDIDLHKCLNKYKSLVLGFSEDKKLLANYFIKASYGNDSYNKILCWYIFGEEMIENLEKNSPAFKKKKYIEVQNPDDSQYEYLGKYYKVEED